MKLFGWILCSCVFTTCLPSAGVVRAEQQRPPDPHVEIYVPQGMPIHIRVTRDESEQSIAKYIVQRTTEVGVENLTTVHLLVGPGSEILRSSRYTTTKLNDPVTIAWASVAKVVRLIVIIERLETRSGVWVFNNQEQRINQRAVLERRMNAIPRAKFIKTPRRP